MKMKKIKKIIFVGNDGTCRAPMAAKIMERLLEGRDIEVCARGIVVLVPEPINQKAEAVMISNGISIEGYSSVELKESDIEDGTIIFTMTREQKEKLSEKISYPHVFVLNEYVGDELEVMDPYGGNIKTYGLLFETLTNTVGKLSDILNFGDKS